MNRKILKYINNKENRERIHAWIYINLFQYE
jgi:hypothetical protein